MLQSIASRLSWHALSTSTNTSLIPTAGDSTKISRHSDVQSRPYIGRILLIARPILPPDGPDTLCCLCLAVHLSPR